MAICLFSICFTRNICSETPLCRKFCNRGAFYRPTVVKGLNYVVATGSFDVNPQLLMVLVAFFDENSLLKRSLSFAAFGQPMNLSLHGTINNADFKYNG
jgi:hypothetical protein